MEEKIYFIELGPRNGGNMIPDLLNYISGKDVIDASIKSSTGNSKIDVAFDKKKCFFATHNLHTNKNGVLKEIKFKKSLERYIIQKEIYKEVGEQVYYFDGANKALGIIFLRFKSLRKMKNYLQKINNKILIIVE